MKRFTSFCVALGLAAAGSSALAEEKDQQIPTQDAKPQPVQMTDAQLDNVAAGLIDVVLIDVVDVRDIQVAIPVNANVLANVAAGVLGTAFAGQAARLGRQVPRIEQTQ
jgi:hypothetical protein